MGAVGEQPIPGTVAALVAYVTHLYEDERKRGEDLESRLGHLTAFSGLLLTLIAPLGANQLGQGHGAAFDVSYIASVAIFAVTALLAVSSSFRNRTVKIDDDEFKMTGWRRTEVSAAELKEYSGAQTAVSTVEAQRQIVANIVGSIIDIRGLNGLRFRLLKQVSAALCAGLLATTAQAVILVT